MAGDARKRRKIYAGNVEAVKGVSLDEPTAPSACWSARRAAASPRCCAWSPASRPSPAARSKIGERVVNEIEPADRDIAMVFQNYALYPHMSVYDNMAYGLRNRGTPKPEIDERVREAARILAIEPLLDRKPRQLSGGQRQRVAMGRAIVRKPQVFLFDEPLSNLDAKLRVQMRVEIKRLQRALGVTSIYVTHDQVEAMTLSDQLVVMNGGDRAGRHAADVYRRPATRFVATFIGSPPMNILQWAGRRRAWSRSAAASCGHRHARRSQGGHAAARSASGPRKGAAKRRGGRPFGGGGLFWGRPRRTASFPGQGGGEGFVVQAPARRDPVPTKPLALAVDAGNVHLFDPVTGERLGARPPLETKSPAARRALDTPYIRVSRSGARCGRRCCRSGARRARAPCGSGLANPSRACSGGRCGR